MNTHIHRFHSRQNIAAIWDVTEDLLWMTTALAGFVAAYLAQYLASHTLKNKRLLVERNN